MKQTICFVIFIFTLSINAMEGAYKLQIKDKYGFAVSDGEVLLGNDWSSEQLFLIENGMAQIPTAKWQEAQTITIESQGFIRTSFVNINPGDKSLFINFDRQKSEKELSGIIRGYGSIKTDDRIDFAITMRAFPRSMFASFDLGQIISEKSDEMKVIGKTVEVPSNISFPKQKERYAFLTVTLDKPSYTIPLGEENKDKIVTIHGKIPFKKSVDYARNDKDMLELINDIRLKQLGLYDINTSTSMTKDLNVNQESLIAAFQVRNTAIPNGTLNVAIALNMLDGYYYPTDIKRMNANDMVSMLSTKNPNRFALGVITPNKNKKTEAAIELNSAISVNFISIGLQNHFEYLPLIQAPTFSNGVLYMNIPSSNLNLQKQATFATLSMAQTTVNETIELTKQSNSWEFYADSWLDSIEIPAWPMDFIFNSPNRWETTFLATDEDTSFFGPESLQKATHATRNVLEL